MMVTRIGLDYDFPFETFNKELFFQMLHDEKLDNDNISFICYRRSGSGNTHVRIYLKIPVPLFRAMQIRAQMKDDSNRILIDLARLGRQGNASAVDVLFDEIIKDGVYMKASPWIELKGGKYGNTTR